MCVKIQRLKLFQNCNLSILVRKTLKVGPLSSLLNGFEKKLTRKAALGNIKFC